jgi:pimeloyl-ACP methyl ester carboxylesterase
VNRTASVLPLFLLLLVFTTAIAHSADWRAWHYDGDPVAYRVDGNGAPVVQVHGIGAGASSEQTKYQIDALVAAGYQVYSLDLPGWGRSIGPQRLYTGQHYADAIAAFLEEVVAKPATLIGHSLGGAYAVGAASTRPDLVTALVLNAPVGVDSFTAESDARSTRLWERFVGSEVGQVLYRWLGSWPSILGFCRTSLYVDPSFCDLRTAFDYRQYTRQPSSIFAAAAFLTNNLGLDIRDHVAGLTQPILLIWGAENAFTPLTEAEGFVALSPSAQLEIIDQAGAMVNDENSALFNQLTLEHLAESLESSVVAD